MTTRIATTAQETHDEPWSLATIIGISVGALALAAVIAVVALRAKRRRNGEKIEAGPWSSTYVGDGSLYILEDLSPCPVLNLRPSTAQDAPINLRPKEKTMLPTVSPFLSTQRMYNPTSVQPPAPYVQGVDTTVQHPSLSESIASYLDSPFRFPSECESASTPRESDESLESYDSSFGPNDTSLSSVSRYRI
ncbi:hypothetical protein ACHHYP_08426 [Achlya hypogyna]|uniref:Uncharacterized protein n=1 Tax=Achlya hypogyna TaxID=1202772 RepID=A0A1V9YPL8_ACHHY|nr:hypothetical protein ACHHYP_08426 [Achlya hypogyna]